MNIKELTIIYKEYITKKNVGWTMAKNLMEYLIIYTSMQWLIQAEGSWHMGLETKSPPLFFLSQTFKLSKQDLSVEYFAKMSLPPLINFGSVPSMV
jgi:hypothetical protein